MKKENQKEIREKIDKLTAEWWGEYGPAIRRQAFADQILELLKSEKAKACQELLKRIKLEYDEFCKELEVEKLEERNKKGIKGRRK